MRNSTLRFHFFKSRLTALLIVTASVLSVGRVFAQTPLPTDCTNCSGAPALTINLPQDESKTVTATGGQVVCIRGTGVFGGTIVLTGSNSALCVGPDAAISSTATLTFGGTNTVITNFGIWEKSFNMVRLGNNDRIEDNGIRRVENYGDMFITINSNPNSSISKFVVTGSATFENYGNLTITGGLEIMNGSNLFANLRDGELTVNGDLIVRGNGNNNGFFQTGKSVIVNGTFIHADNNSNTLLTAPLRATNLSILGGRVTGGVTSTNCGRFDITGTSTITNGSFGANNTYLGVCNPNTNTSGFTNPPGVAIPPNANLGCACVQALPISLLYFTARQHNNQVILHWATASETDNDYFSLEKSRDGQQFNEVGRVDGAGTSTQKLTYQFADDFPFNGTTYYRLKQVDLDKTFTYSKIVAVNSQVTAALKVYPNPLTKDELWVEVNDAQADDMRITIHNAIGKPLVDHVYAYEPAVKVNLAALRREPGLYIITVRRKNRVERQKLVIQ